MPDNIDSSNVNSAEQNKPKKEIETPSPFLENVAEQVSEETLRKIGRTVVEDFDTDVASRGGWDSRVKEWYTLFSGVTPKKTHPWPDASNVSIPILSTACLQFQARVYDALLPSKEIAKCFSTDGQSVDTAARCQKFMNWQLTEQMEEWEEDMDALFMDLPLAGSVIKKTYYDAVLERVVSISLRIEDFAVPYGVRRLEDAPRKTHKYEIYLNDLRLKGEDKVWINTDKINMPAPATNESEPASEYKQKADEVSGVEDNLQEKDRPRVILEQHRNWDLDGDGIQEPYIITVDKETEAVLRIESRWYLDPVTGKVKTFDYFTAYNFLPNPNSFMGYGFGHLLEHLNHTINSLTNQLNDSGTLSNTICGFVNRRSGIKTGDLEYAMGELKSVDLSTDDIRKAIYTFNFNPPSNVLFTLLQMLQNYSRELSSVSESMLGKLPPSDTTATSMLAVMEQGLKVFSTIHKRVHRYFKKELKKIAILNSLYLDESVYFTVQDSTSEEIQTLQSGRQDFQNNIDVIPTSDPTITSRAEKLIRARQAYEFGMQNPLIANDPTALYELSKEVYKALEVQNIDEILKQPEPQEPPDLSPEQEEAEFLAERGVQPLPEQDHAAHLESHNTFKESDWSERLTAQGKKLLDAHMRETWALLYIQQQQLEAQQKEAIRNEMLSEAVPGVARPPLFEGGAGTPPPEGGELERGFGT